MKTNTNLAPENLEQAVGGVPNNEALDARLQSAPGGSNSHEQQLCGFLRPHVSNTEVFLPTKFETLFQETRAELSRNDYRHRDVVSASDLNKTTLTDRSLLDAVRAALMLK